NPAAALRWLDPITDMLQAGGIGEPGCYPFTPDPIEAWAATGHLGRAAARLAWLQDTARRLDHPSARITSGRGRPGRRAPCGKRWARPWACDAGAGAGSRGGPGGRYGPARRARPGGAGQRCAPGRIPA